MNIVLQVRSQPIRITELLTFFLYGLMVQLNKDNDNIFTVPSAFALLPTQQNAPVS